LKDGGRHPRLELHIAAQVEAVGESAMWLITRKTQAARVGVRSVLNRIPLRARDESRA